MSYMDLTKKYIITKASPANGLKGKLPVAG